MEAAGMQDTANPFRSKWRLSVLPDGSRNWTANPSAEAQPAVPTEPQSPPI